MEPNSLIFLTLISNCFKVVQWPFVFLRNTPVFQKMDSTNNRINLYPVDSAIGFPNTVEPRYNDMPREQWN